VGFLVLFWFCLFWKIRRMKLGIGMENTDFLARLGKVQRNSSP